MDWWGWLYPKKCVGCGKWGAYVCSRCEMGIWEAEQVCPGCGKEAKYGCLHKGCKGVIGGLSCLWANEGLVRKMMRRARSGYVDYATDLVKMGAKMIEREEFGELRKFLELKPVVWSRQNELAVRLAKYVADEWGLKIRMEGESFLVVSDEWSWETRTWVNQEFGGKNKMGWGITLVK